ncbi:MAG: murein hydrolase activator EnvC family protein [Dysgonomonas sp.]
MKRVCCISFILIIISISAFPQTNKIKELEKQRKQMLLEIETTNRLLIDTKKTTTTLMNRIKLISAQISSRQKVVSLLDQEIKNLNRQQNKIEQDIKNLETDLKAKQNNYATAIKSMIRREQNANKMLFVLSGKSIGESLRRMKYMRDYSEWRNQQAEEIKQKKAELSEKKTELEKTKKEKQNLLAQRKAEQEKLKVEENSKQQEVGEANKKQKQLQAELSKKQKQAKALNSQIEKLIAEEVARQEREAKRIAAEKAKAGKPVDKAVPTTETTESFKLSSNFVSNRGKFPMPVTGRSVIVNRFGRQHHSQWNVTTNNSGIDIQAQEGSEARAIFEGEVSRVIAFPGYNNCIIVRHGGYYTFYGNIQQVYVKQGQKVLTGQSLGKIFTDSDSGNTEMHFQLWQGTNKLNPELWLRK